MNIIPHPRIPDGWIIEHSAQYNCPFYVNNYTNESIWTIPTAPAIPLQSAPSLQPQQQIQGYPSPAPSVAQYSSPAAPTNFVGGQPTPSYTPLSANQCYFPAQNGQQYQQQVQNHQQSVPHAPQAPSNQSGQQAGSQLTHIPPQNNQYAPQASYAPQQNGTPLQSVPSQTSTAQGYVAELAPNNPQGARIIQQKSPRTSDIPAPVAQHVIPNATSDSAPTVVDHLTQISAQQDLNTTQSQHRIETPVSPQSLDPPPPAYSLPTPVQSPVAVSAAPPTGSTAPPLSYGAPIDQTQRDAYGNQQVRGSVVVPQQQYPSQTNTPVMVPVQYQAPPANGSLHYPPATQQAPAQQVPAQYMPVQQVPAQYVPIQQTTVQQVHPQPGVVPVFYTPNGQQQNFPPQPVQAAVSPMNISAAPPQQHPQHQQQHQQPQYAGPQQPQQAVVGQAPAQGGPQSAPAGEKGIVGDLLGAFKGAKMGKPVSSSTAQGGKKQTGLVAGAMAGAIGASAMLGGIMGKAGNKQAKPQQVRPQGAAPFQGAPQGHGVVHAPQAHGVAYAPQQGQGQVFRQHIQGPMVPQGAGRGQAPKAGQAALVGGIAALGIGALALGKAGKHSKHGGGHGGGHVGHGGHSGAAEDQTAYNQDQTAYSQDPAAATYNDGSGGIVYYDNSGAAQQSYATDPTYVDGSGGTVYYDNSGTAGQTYATDPTYVDDMTYTDTSYADTSYVDDGSGMDPDAFGDSGAFMDADATSDMLGAADFSAALAEGNDDMMSALF
jgi:hypothetical protein